MAPEDDQETEAVARVLAQSLPKPGVAEAMRFWHLTRSGPLQHSGNRGEHFSETQFADAQLG